MEWILSAWLTQRVSCQCNVRCTLQWIANKAQLAQAEPSKLCCCLPTQDAKYQLRDLRCPLWRLFPLSSRASTYSTQKIDGCACVHALQGVSCLLLRNMPCRKLPILDSRPLFRHQVKLLLLPVWQYLLSPKVLYYTWSIKAGKWPFYWYHDAHLNWLCDTDD